MANRNEIVVKSIDVAGLRRMFGEGKFATVNFTKKSNGENRTLNGKLLVKAALAGGVASYDAESRGQLRVVDVNVYKNGQRRTEFRAVVAENINWVTSKGVKYVVENPQPIENFVQNLTYILATRTVSVVLSGVKYLYKNVPLHVFKGWNLSENKGAFFNEQIKGKYDFLRVH